jgi:hypothetical protein
MHAYDIPYSNTWFFQPTSTQPCSKIQIFKYSKFKQSNNHSITLTHSAASWLTPISSSLSSSLDEPDEDLLLPSLSDELRAEFRGSTCIARLQNDKAKERGVIQAYATQKRGALVKYIEGYEV